LIDDTGHRFDRRVSVRIELVTITITRVAAIARLSRAGIAWNI
jgi:hypothetical protein